MRAAENEPFTQDQAAPWTQRAPRTVTTLLIGKLVSDVAGEALCRIRNLSATGMMIETPQPLGHGNSITVELRCRQRLHGNVVWSSEGRAGVRFAEPIDVHSVLAIIKGNSPAPPLHKEVPRARRSPSIAKPALPAGASPSR